MGKKKIQTILAVSAMVGSATIVGHQIPTSQNSTILFENSNNQADSSKSNKDIKQTNSKSNNLNKTTNLEQVNINQNPSNKPIDYKKDLKIVVTGINIDKVSDGSNNPNTSYQPENNVPSTGNIVTQNTIVTYSIHVSLRSASGRIYPISGASLTANPIVSYMGIKNETPQEKEALSQLQQSIQVQLNKLKNLNSTSTFVISASFNVGYADWNAQILPNLTLNITTPNGEVISTPLNIKPLKETMQYTDSVIANPSIVPDRNNKHCHYLRIGINNQAMSYSPGVYNPKNQNAKTVTFTINNPDTKNITITSLNIPGLIKNADGTYTASISLLDSGHNLFKITTNTNSQLRVPITVTPVKEELESSSSNINASEATKMNYYGGQAILKQRDLGCHFSMTQSSQTSYSSQPNYEGYNNNLVTFGSTMTTGVPGKYNVYTGSLVTNGEIVVKNANAPQGVNLINNGQVYCHLDDSAVNILKSGTPAQKAQIMEDIVSGNMSNIGVKYTSSELQTLMNEGKTVPSLNFTYIEKGYDGDNFNDGSSYVTVPTNGNNNPVISRTITFGDLQGTYSQDEQEQMSQELKGGQLPSDGVVENNGKLQGFILSPPNSYTDSDVKSRNIGQITDERYGNYSRGLSAAYNNASADISVTADNTIGSSTQTTTSVQPYSWFLKQHQFNVNIQGYGDGPSLMLNNTTITVNMGHSFKLIPGKSLYFGSAKLSPSDYSVEGDKLIIHSNKDIAQSLGSAPTITFSAQYTNTQSIDKNITLGVSLSGKNDGDGMVYQYNNKEVPAQQGGIPTIHSYKTQIVVSQVVSNQCIHSATDLSNGDVQLQDQVLNNNLKSKTYYIAGEIPITGSNNLPGNDGEPSTGGLSSELQTLNTGGVPTWVLPKSAMNSENEEILTSASGNDLKGSLKYIESPNSGWIKYKPGMNLNNIIGYFTTPTVGPRDEFNMTYNVKLKQGDNPDGLPEVVNSAFKYYDVTDNIGSTSNIVNITTPGTDLSNNWISTVKEVDGGKLTQQDLDKTVTINGKIVSLKDFIGTGPDLDANYDNTPTKLMNEVTLSQDKEALAKLGYQLVNITVNGKVRDLSWFENTGIAYNTGLTEVIFNIKKIAPTVTKADTTVTENYSNGELVTPSITTTNNIGAKVNTGLPELPKGYQVVKVTVNGQEVTQSEVPSTQGSKDQVIIYTIGKQPTDTIKVINEKGIQVGKTISVTGDTGSKTGLEVPTIPNGYHVVSEIINGKEGTGVPSTFGDSNTNIIYNIAPNVKDETYGSIVTDTGKTLVPVTPLNQGEPGSKATVQMPNIPKGYKIVKVTINNGEVPISSNGKYEVTYDNNVSKEVDNKIVITVKHIPVQDTIKVMEGSKIVSTTKTKEGMPGEDTGIQTPNIPNGYHIDKITVDGNTVTTVPKTFGDSNQTIIYHLTENKVNDIKADVVTESGQPLVNNTTVAEGPEGSDVTCNKTEIPEGYHLVKVEYNGKVISSTTGGKVIYMLPDTIPTGKAGQLTYVVAPNTSTVNVKVVGGPGLKPYSHTTSGTVGSKITGDIPPIPKGYKVTNITVNGHAVSENKLPETYGNKTYNIVYHVVKIPTGEIQQTVVTTGGTVIEKPTVVASGEVGSNIIVKPYTAPKGYHIVKVEIDGKELTTQEEKDLIHNLPNTINSPKTEVVKYVIAKDTTPSVAQKGTIIIKVVDQQNISVVPEKTYTGTVGDKTPNMVPTIPNGDTLQKITSGQVTPVSGLPDTFSPGVHIYVYHVIEHKGSLTYTINVNGQPIRREYLTGVDGQTASYGLPHNKDWKLENIIVDGKKIPVDGNSDYHGVYSEDGTQVIYNYKTVTPNVTPQPTKPVKPEHKDTPIVKPNKGDNTPSGDVNHNGGNTTPSQSGDKGNTPNKGDNTPSKGGNNGGSTKTSTSTHTEVTGGGEAHSTGTAHATVNGSGSSTSTSSSSVNGRNNNSTGTASNTTPNIVSGGNNGNTVTPHVVVNTTSSNGVVSNNTTTSNGNDTIPFNSSSVSSSAGSTYTDNNLVNGPNEDDSTAQTVLPHTGLSTQNVENTAEQAGALAGIMAMLGGVFFFRRKK